MISVHPEGKRYAHKITEDGISVVTESHVTDPGVAEQLEDCLAMIRVLTVEEDIHLAGTTDLFLEIDQNSRRCSYWFADHAHRTIFWLHRVDTKTVGLPDSYSKLHLRESYTVFTSSNEFTVITPVRIRPGGKLLDPRRDVPCHRISIFDDCIK